MSRAFVKEPDGTEPIELTERQISKDRNFVTRSGLLQIESEIKRLQLEFKSNPDELAKSQLQRDLRYWLARHESAELILESENVQKIVFGHYITLENNEAKKVLRIVGQDEADPESWLISYTAPLAQELIGKQVGDEVKIGNQDYEIVQISYHD